MKKFTILTFAFAAKPSANDTSDIQTPITPSHPVSKVCQAISKEEAHWFNFSKDKATSYIEQLQAVASVILIKAWNPGHPSDQENVARIFASYYAMAVGLSTLDFDRWDSQMAGIKQLNEVWNKAQMMDPLLFGTQTKARASIDNNFDQSATAKSLNIVKQLMNKIKPSTKSKMEKMTNEIKHAFIRHIPLLLEVFALDSQASLGANVAIDIELSYLQGVLKYLVFTKNYYESAESFAEWKKSIE